MAPIRQNPSQFLSQNYLIAFAITVLVWSSYKLTEAVIPLLLSDQMSVSPSEIGMILGLSSISAILTRPLAGYAIDKFGRRHITHQTRMTRHYTHLNSFYEEAQDQGLKPSSIIIKKEIIPVGDALAGKLEIQTGARVHYVERLRMLNNDPIALHVVILPFELFPNLSRDHLEGSLYHYYHKQGMEAVWASQRIEARSATRKQCELLKLPRNAPVLYSARITYTKNDIPIEWVESVAGGSPYAIEITLNREE